MGPTAIASCPSSAALSLIGEAPADRCGEQRAAVVDGTRDSEEEPSGGESVALARPASLREWSRLRVIDGRNEKASRNRLRTGGQGVLYRLEN